MREGVSWADEVYQVPNVRVLEGFAESLGQLKIDKSTIKGDILIAGPAFVCPERALICTPQTRYGRLRDEVTSVTCCDPDHPLNNYFFELPIKHQLLSEPLPLDRKAIYFYCTGLKNLLDVTSPETFDVIMFFRNNGLYKRLDIETMQLVKRSLKIGGYFMGSGSFRGTDIPFAEGIEPQDVRDLGEGDTFPFHPYHIGFVAQRVS